MWKSVIKNLKYIPYQKLADIAKGEKIKSNEVNEKSFIKSSHRKNKQQNDKFNPKFTQSIILRKKAKK